MSRAPFQILVHPYRMTQQGLIEYAVFQRPDAGFWQGVAGGGEDDETPLQAAMRETFEETGLNLINGWIELDTTASIPVTAFRDFFLWGEDVYVIPQYSFGVLVQGLEITLSHEHKSYRWLPYQEACDCLKFDSGRTTLWELNTRLMRG